MQFGQRDMRIVRVRGLFAELAQEVGAWAAVDAFVDGVLRVFRRARVLDVDGGALLGQIQLDGVLQRLFDDDAI